MEITGLFQDAAEVWYKCLWMPAKFFSNRYSSYSFSPILVKLGIYNSMCQCAKTQEQIFKILIFKFFGDFFK